MDDTEQQAEQEFVPKHQFHWQAYEHEHTPRDNDWFWALGVVAICLAITAVLFDDALFGILILLAAMLFALHARHIPEIIEFEINDKGLHIGNESHRFDEIISFWIDEKTNPPILLIDTIKPMSPNIIIPLDQIDHSELRKFLLSHCLETPMQEPFSHKLIEMLGL